MGSSFSLKVRPRRAEPLAELTVLETTLLIVPTERQRPSALRLAGNGVLVMFPVVEGVSGFNLLLSTNTPKLRRLLRHTQDRLCKTFDQQELQGLQHKDCLHLSWQCWLQPGQTLFVLEQKRLQTQHLTAPRKDTIPVRDNVRKIS